MDTRIPTIFEAFAAACKKNPQKEIIYIKEFKNFKGITYKSLNKSIGKLCSFLLNNNIREKSRVAIVLENGHLWPVSFLALMRLGAVCVPLNPQLDLQDMRTFLVHSDSTCILTSSKLYSLIKQVIADLDIKVVALDARETAKEIDASIELRGQSNADEKDLASIIYTSGTTSTPKGVMLTHKNLLSNVASIEKLNIITPDDCLISVLPFYHTYPFMVNLLLPLLTSARISFPLYIEPQEITDCIKRTNVTVFVGVPRLFTLFHERIKNNINSLYLPKRILLEILLRTALGLRKAFKINIAKPIFSELHEKFGSHFRFMISGGAKLKKEIAQDFYKWGFTMLEGYGLTETSPVVTFNRPHSNKIGSVGQAVNGVEIKIVKPDEQGRGEVAVKGDNVFSGYYKAEELTKIAIHNEWFFTGDVGTIDKKGFLYIHNRKKEVIILSSGKNINPEELESYYTQSPYIQELCIFATQDQARSKDILSAAILPNYEYLRSRGITQIRDRIRMEIEAISHTIPSYKRITKYIIISEKLPRTALGKLKRYAVKEKYAIRWEETKPQTEMTEEDKRLIAHPLCKKAFEYLCNKLNKTVSLDDNLEIDLGLDSLEQIGLFLGFQEVTQVELQEQDLFNIFTVRDVLLILANTSKTQTATVKPKTTTLEDIFSQVPSEEIKRSISLKRSRMHNITNCMIRIFVKTVTKVFFRLSVKGLENVPEKGPLILCPNHASFLDGPLVFASLSNKIAANTYFLGYKAYFDNIFMKWAKEPLGLIPIEARLDLTESLMNCSHVLRGEKILCVFGEGGRSVDGNLMEFKRGLGIIIKELETPVVPVYIKGSFKAWSRYRRLPRPAKITVTFGKPLSPDTLMSDCADGVDIYKNIVHNLRSELLKLQSSS